MLDIYNQNITNFGYKYLTIDKNGSASLPKQGIYNFGNVIGNPATKIGNSINSVAKLERT